MTSTLSLEQAPPLSVPLRFFLTAPLFGMAAAGLLLWAGPEALASRWTPAALALTHLLALGVLTMVMCGALFQMLPVLVGVRVPRPRLVGGLCHALLTLGCLALAAGFLGAGVLAFRLAAGCLGLGFGLFILVIGYGLARAPRVHDSVRGMRWALFGLAVATGLGLHLTLGHGWSDWPLLRGPLTDLHLSWALVGWVALLVAVVAWQVVPMFQVTAEYPPLLRRYLAATLCGLLSLLSLGTALTGEVPAVAVAALAAVLMVFAGQTLRLLARRRRRRTDSSFAFWSLGMAALMAATVAAVAHDLGLLPARTAALPVVMFIMGFALSVVSGMLGKIVPFLVWLHLQQQLAAHPAAIGRITPPNMHAVLPEARARWHFGTHGAALALLLAGVVYPALLAAAALFWWLAFVLLGFNLLAAARLYGEEQRKIRLAQ